MRFDLTVRYALCIPWRIMLTSQDITRARKRRGMTQSELAEAAGVDLSTVWRWENKSPPSRGTAKVFVERFIAESEAAPAPAETAA